MIDADRLKEIYEGEMEFTATLKIGETFWMQGIEFVITDVGMDNEDFWLEFKPVESE